MNQGAHIRSYNFCIAFIFMMIALNFKAFTQGSASSQPAHLSSAKVFTRNLKTSAIWYKKFLGFKISDVKMNESAKLKIPGFQIQLVQPKRTVIQSNLKLPEGKTFVNGFYEFGFIVNNIDSLFVALQDRNVPIDSALTYDESVGRKTMTVLDPDRNRIVLFENTSDISIPTTPYLFTIFTSDYKNTLNWYSTRMGFNEIKDLDAPMENLYMRLLQRGSVLLKIIHSPNRSVETTELLTNDIELAGFKQLGFLFRTGGKSVREIDNDGNVLMIKK